MGVAIHSTRRVTIWKLISSFEKLISSEFYIPGI